MKFFRPFLFGMIAALGALVSEMALGIIFGYKLGAGDIIFNKATPLLVAAVIVEEIFKFSFVYKNYGQILAGPGLRNLKREIIASSLLIGAGFASVELFFAFSGLAASLSFPVAALLLTGILTVHLTTVSVMGYSAAISGPKTFYFFAKTLSTAFILHMAYNLLVAYSFRLWVICAYLVFLAIIFLSILARAIADKSGMPDA